MIARSTTSLYTLTLTTLFRSGRARRGRHGAGVREWVRVDGVCGDVDRLRARDLRRPGSGTHRPEPIHERDRKSTRLNSSHMSKSYAVFCVKKQNEKNFLNNLF